MSGFSKLIAVLLVITASVFGFQAFSAADAGGGECCCGEACGCKSCECTTDSQDNCQCSECCCSGVCQKKG